MKRKEFFPAAVMIGILITVVSGCGADGSNPYGTPMPPNVPPNTVVMSSGSFTPSHLTISSGTTVTWRNDDAVVHTSTSDAALWDTGDMPARASRTTTFSTPGTYAYHCTYHSAMGMVGTITVQ